MILSTLIYTFFLIGIGLILFLFFSKGRLRRFAIGITIFLIILPLCFVAFLGIFKSQIQQGKILPQLGPILILLSPPDDIKKPLGVVYLTPNKKEYNLKITHKYLGNHEILLYFKKLNSYDELEKTKKELFLTVEFKYDSRIIYSTTSERPISYYSYAATENKSVISFIRYNVPNNLPIDTPLQVKIKVEGNIEQFIEKYGPVRIEIKKGSDI